MADKENPKIYIDDDWKRQAQEEKHRLAEKEIKVEETKAKEEKAPSAAQPDRLPKPGFDVLVSTFTTQTLMALGIRQHPNMQPMLDLELAKFNIDMLAVLEEKTKGNLTSQEKAILDQTLHQLRMAFVEVAAANVGPIGAE
jgi:hypothetical protein